MTESHGSAAKPPGQELAIRRKPDEQPSGLRWQEFTDGLYRNRVTLTAAALIMIQVIWKWNVLAHSYFRQDDFAFTARAVGHHLTDPSYILRVELGRLFPGGWAVMWFLARISPYDWGLWGGTLLVLQTLAGLAVWKVLRTLFGNRPAILVPLTVALFTPLTIKAMAWFAAGIIYIPFQIAAAMAVDAHARYVRGRRPLHLGLAALWTLLGIAFNQQAVAIPLLLFAVTSAFLVQGGWPSAMRRSLQMFRGAWAIYAALIIGEVGLYLSRLHTSEITPKALPMVSDATTFGADLITKTFIPGAFGGPWHWISLTSSDIEPYANAPSGLVWLSWLAAAGVIGASLWFRRRAWRSWMILFGWLVVVDVIPTAVGRLWVTGIASPGLNSRYVADAVPVLAICLGLAFLPLVGERDAYRASLPEPAGRRLLPTITGAALGIVLVSSLLSASGFTGRLQFQPIRSYVATADAALQAVPTGTVIFDQFVPANVINAILAGRRGYGYQSRVLEPLVRQLHKNIVWAAVPPQTPVFRPMVFDQLGRLHPADVAGIRSAPNKKCYLPTPRGALILLTHAVPPGTWTMRVAYFGTKINLGVYFGGRANVMTLPQSPITNTFVRIQGGGSSLLIRSFGGGACIDSVTIGTLQPAPFAPPTPLFPVLG